MPRPFYYPSAINADWVVYVNGGWWLEPNSCVWMVPGTYTGD